MTEFKWNDKARVHMIEKSEIYGDSRVYQYGFYDGYMKAIKDCKSNEMLDRIEQMNIDLKILLHNMMREEKINHRVEGYPKVIQQWIEDNEQLIKEATEL